MNNEQINQTINVFLVGGAVRDQLLDRKVIERDYVVVGSNVKQMLSLGFNQVGKDFPVFLHPETKEEYALARTEKKQGHGYTGFICHSAEDVTLEQDLLRRDLTVNAMAQASDGAIIDPYNGQQDLKNRMLRHVSSAFCEDPLRVLRVARFAARYHYLGFSIAEETMELMKKISASGELSSLSGERIWKELERALGEKNPEVFFKILQHCGALHEIWPALSNLWHTKAQDTQKYQSLAELSLAVLQQAVKLSDNTSIRFACLCLYMAHQQSGEQQNNITGKLKLPNAPKLLATKCQQHHEKLNQLSQLSASDILSLFDHLDAWRKPDFFNDFLMVCQAEQAVLTQGERTDSTPFNMLNELLLQCNQVSAKTYVEQGLTGKAIKSAITNARLALINEQITSLN